MLVHSNIKSAIKTELLNAKSIWFASAMISYSGWLFIQNNLLDSVQQHYLIGIDLATDPKVFEAILSRPEISARVYETKYTFHPKVYLIQKEDNSFVAFIGSSNTTTWGFEKNIEMNFQINDHDECLNIRKWFNSLYSDGYMITRSFLDEYKKKFVRANIKAKETEKESTEIKTELTKDKGQFFSLNDHEIFNNRYHEIETEDLKENRKEVSDKFKELHKIIYPQFNRYGLIDLHEHYEAKEIVSRYFFNDYSGNYINAMWLHYGKSFSQLQVYKTKDKSTNRPHSFINNIRMQVIIHENDIGIWLALGRNSGSIKDREHFHKQMSNITLQKKFYASFKALGDDYWINKKSVKNINNQAELMSEIAKENINEYFIIGCNLPRMDQRLSKENISSTVLTEFKKLYPLYEIMRHK
jgi:hypothetical protein